jgi:hypothetical protein
MDNVQKINTYDTGKWEYMGYKARYRNGGRGDTEANYPNSQSG